MKKSLIFFGALILLQVVRKEVDGCKSTARAAGKGVAKAIGKGIEKASGKSVAKATGRGINNMPKYALKSIKSQSKTVWKVSKNPPKYVLTLTKKLGRWATKNPLEAGNLIASLGLCIAAGNWKDCNKECEIFRDEIKTTNKEISNIMENLTQLLNEIQEKTDTVDKITNHHQNISFYFKKLDQIIGDAIVDHRKIAQITELVKEEYNISHEASNSKEEYTKALEYGFNKLRKNMEVQMKTTDIMLYSIEGTSLTAVIGLYTLKRHLKLNIEWNEKWDFLTKRQHFYKKVKRYMKKTMTGSNLLMAAACGAQIKGRMNITKRATSLAAEKLNLIKGLKNKLTYTLDSVKKNKKQIFNMITKIVNEIKEEYKNILEAGAYSFCKTNINTNLCIMFREKSEKCSLTITEIDDLETYLSHFAIKLKFVFTFLSEKRNEMHEFNMTKSDALKIIEEMRDYSLSANKSCTMLEKLYKARYVNVCDEIYSSGLYNSLGKWSEWSNNGNCNLDNCLQSQTRSCPTKCIGTSTIRTIQCMETCVPQDFKKFDDDFMRVVKQYCF